MNKSNPETQEGDDSSLIEDIYQINYISLGEGAATCQVCGSPLQEGDAVVVYAFRSAGEVMFQVGYVVCGGRRHKRPEVFTLGVRELLVEGRIGLCSDGATQSSWPVLLAPEVVGVSVAATKSLRLIPDGGSKGSNVASGGVERESAESSMEEKDELWRSECRPEFVRALQARAAQRDGDVPVPGDDDGVAGGSV